MFTGIVQAVGRIQHSEALGFGRRLTIHAPALGLDDVRIGDSIAINGACMTLTSKTAREFTIDVSAESLSKTAGLEGRGHVDGTGKVVVMEQRGESWLLIVEAPAALARYFAYKGSVTVNGVSLTVNQVEDVLRGGERAGCNLWINLIPHTVAVTTLVQLKPGDRVNLEVDMLARYVERMLSLQAR
jgi:riboflavin synthase